MTIKENYVLQEVLGDYIVVPIGEEADRMNGVLKLNETGAFLWKCLTEHDCTEADLIAAMMGEYSIDQAAAHKDVSSFVDALRTLDVLDKSVSE